MKQAYLSSEPKKPRLITGKADSEEDDENSGAMWIGQDTIFGQVHSGRSALIYGPEIENCPEGVTWTVLKEEKTMVYKLRILLKYLN